MAGQKRYFDQSSQDGSSPQKGGGNKRFNKGKEPFKPKEGFIAKGLKQYTTTVEEEDTAVAEKKAKLSEGWKDKTTTLTTLHLTRLPSSLTSPQLSLLMSSYAPVRSAFVVSTSSSSSSTSTPGPSSGPNAVSTKTGADRTGKSTSRGFGYVRFVLREDAEKCLAEWGSKGIPSTVESELRGVEGMEGVAWEEIVGKGGVKMDWAKKKLKEGEEPEGGSRKKKVVVKSGANEGAEDQGWGEERVRSKVDHNAPRTVVVMGLPNPDEPAPTPAPVEQEAEAEEEDATEDNPADTEIEMAEPTSTKAVDWIKFLKQKTRKVSSEIEHVSYPVRLGSSPEVLATILLPTPRLAHDLSKKLHNHVLRGILLSACVKSSWDLVERQGKAKGGGRLVVRNLDFETTLQDLRHIFSPFGALHSISLPLNPTSPTQHRGFAFIYYLSRSSAEKALEKVNGTRISPGCSEERIRMEGGKEGKKKEVREKRKKEAAEGGGGGGGEKGRLVAVDWALEKGEFMKAKEAEVEVEGLEEESQSESDEDEDEEEEEEYSDLDPIAEGDLSEEEDDDLDEEITTGTGGNDVVESEPEQPKGTTLFVRNMSFEATESELYDLFKAFGPVRYARIVYDSTTKRSRGTAFVCFWNEEDAMKVLRASEELNQGVFGETSNKHAKNKSLLTADTSSSKALGLTLHGRVLAAVLAVSKGDADTLREDRDKKGEAKTDRRNLYLMREGVIFPSWAIAQTLLPSDVAARQSSFDARKSLLRTNPSLYISRTRLSVRQIPLYVSDGMMKRLANYAIKQFDKEVKEGLQKPLTKEELAAGISDAGGSTGIPQTKAERIRGVPPSKVRQAKILRQSDRVDPLTGLGRSKGYGFLELGSHSDALKVLRWANANKDVGNLFRVWWRDTLEKLIEKEASGESVMGKGVKTKDREERKRRLEDKMKELIEEEELARGKAARKEAKGKPTGEGGRSSKCLIIEFSIENAQTTKRRAEKADRARERAKRSKARQESDDEVSEAEESNPKKRKNEDTESAGKKKAKVASDKKKEILDKDRAEGATEGASKLWTGAIIGKKRRMKAGKK